MSPRARSELDDVEAWRSFTQSHSRFEGLGKFQMLSTGLKFCRYGIDGVRNFAPNSTQFQAKVDSSLNSNPQAI